MRLGRYLLHSQRLTFFFLVSIIITGPLFQTLAFIGEMMTRQVAKFDFAIFLFQSVDFDGDGFDWLICFRFAIGFQSISGLTFRITRLLYFQLISFT